MENENKIYPIEVECVRCGSSFVISPGEQKFCNDHNFQLPKRCPNCRKLRKQVEKRICIDCNGQFEINELEKEYYLEHECELPKRCPECRKFYKERTSNN